MYLVDFGGVEGGGDGRRRMVTYVLEGRSVEVFKPESVAARIRIDVLYKEIDAVV